jgi:phosphoribosylaminoimidazole (AIR) synthetase
MGIGLVLVVEPGKVDQVVRSLAAGGERAVLLGEVGARPRGGAPVLLRR